MLIFCLCTKHIKRIIMSNLNYYVFFSTNFNCYIQEITQVVEYYGQKGKNQVVCPCRVTTSNQL